MDDYKKLTPALKHAELLNRILDAFESVYNEFFRHLQDAVWMLNLDTCSGEYLDRVGLLIGIRRQVVYNQQKNFLKTDDKYYPFDSTTFYVDKATGEELQALMNDEQYRQAIKGQIYKNTLRKYTVNEFERLAKIILSDDDYSGIKATWRDFKRGTLLVQVTDDMEDSSVELLQKSYTDAEGRKIFAFPYPPTVKDVVVTKDLDIT